MFRNLVEPASMGDLVRAESVSTAGQALATDDLRQAVRRVLRNGFFTSPGFGLWLRHEPGRSVAWELLGGHLLDEAQTRSRRTFESWEVVLTCGDDSTAAQPLVAILRQDRPAALCIVRYLKVRSWE